MRCGFRRLITVAGLLCVLGGLVSRLDVWWVWCLTRLLGVRVGAGFGVGCLRFGCSLG